MNHKSIEISVVIPVYKSAKFIEKTVNECQTHLDSWCANRYEIILVNDGSPDDSWEVIKHLAIKNTHVVAINLVKNYGQHMANYCGLSHAIGQYIVTMDDDLQNPPEEIAKLYEKAQQGHDLVVGKFESKKHSSHRRWGSKMVQYLNEKVFSTPEHFKYSNFRMIHRSIIQRILKHKTHYPYISGLSMMYAYRPINVLVKHNSREAGESNYTIKSLGKLTLNIVFSYSKIPLRFVSFIGVLISIICFVIALYFFVKFLVIGSSVAGWTSIMLLTSILFGVLFLTLAIIGEYVGRIIAHLHQTQTFHVQAIIDNRNNEKCDVN